MARKSKTDPTGQARNRKAASVALKRRLDNSQRRTKALFRAIPRKRRQKKDIVNNRIFYDYEMTATELAELSDAIGVILNDELLETQDDQLPVGWYFDPRIEIPYRQGTIEETKTINDLIIAAGVTGLVIDGISVRQLQIEQILLSQPYREAVRQAVTSNFEIVKTLSQRTSSQVFGVIERGISAGDTPRTISNAIQERFNVSRSSADRIANTEVNKAYNNAKMRLGKQASEEIGLRTALLHISALLPTTRAHHAARHGNIYTVEAQLSWWDSSQGGSPNRINCHCTTETILVDSKGRAVDAELQKMIKDERAFFDSQL